MVVSDAPSKIKRKPNKVKYNEDCRLTKLDECIKHELDQFQEKFHVDMWGNIADTLLGPHVFLNTPQIIHLCYLSHTNAPQTLEDLENNFQWNWMQYYSLKLLELINHVYNVEPSTSMDGIHSNPQPLPARCHGAKQ